MYIYAYICINSKKYIFIYVVIEVKLHKMSFHLPHIMFSFLFVSIPPYNLC